MNFKPWPPPYISVNLSASVLPVLRSNVVSANFQLLNQADLDISVDQTISPLGPKPLTPLIPGKPVLPPSFKSSYFVWTSLSIILCL